MKDPRNNEPMFATFCVELCCADCKEKGKQAECTHMLHLTPQWQSSEKHERLHVIMQDRPDLIQSELSGLAFDSLQQAFRAQDVDRMFELPPAPIQMFERIHIFVDPAAGGPASDYAILSLTSYRGVMTVRCLFTNLQDTPPSPSQQNCTQSAFPQTSSPAQSYGGT